MIQRSFKDQSAWNAAKVTVAQQFGWTIDRLQKNAMVLEAALEKIHKKGQSSTFRSYVQRSYPLSVIRIR